MHEAAGGSSGARLPAGSAVYVEKLDHRRTAAGRVDPLNDIGREAASVGGLIFSSHGEKYNCQHDDPPHDDQRGHCSGSYFEFLFRRVSAHSTPWFAGLIHL
jgi:hypothetical protein